MTYKTPKKLKSINIMGTSINIVINDNNLHQLGAMGKYEEGTITLLSEYRCALDFVDTFTHECFHALQSVLGTQLDPNLEEILANTVGQMQIHMINVFLEHGTFIEKKK